MKQLVNNIIKQQQEYIYKTNKSKLQKMSQFFTPINIAKKMVKELDFFDFENESIYILEPSAGFGILIFNLIDKIIQNKAIKNIDLTCFELDCEISKFLSFNLENLKIYLSDEFNINFSYTVINTNFINYYNKHWMRKNTSGKFDIIISNPPYKKINRNDEEATIMKDIVYGQPNIYQLFIAMSISLLAPHGVYIAITPRNYLTGSYSKLLRKYIFNNYHVSSIHSFDDMNMFKEVNQEVIISKIKNTKTERNITISHNGNFKFTTDLKNIIVSDDYAIIVPKASDDITTFSQFKSLNNTLDDLNIKISVGPVVQFRNKEFLSKYKYNKTYAPLLISGDIKQNNILDYNNRSISDKATHNKSINISSRNIIKNSNYLLLRKIASKKDNRLITVSILKENYFNHEYLGLDNNILYFSKIGDNFDIFELTGLYCYLNSNSFEKYYSIINGTYTINVTDFKYIHFPTLKTLKQMGKKLIQSSDYSKENCEIILKNFILLKK